MMRPRSATSTSWATTCWIVSDARSQSEEQARVMTHGEPMVLDEQALPRERHNGGQWEQIKRKSSPSAGVPVSWPDDSDHQPAD